MNPISPPQQRRMRLAGAKFRKLLTPLLSPATRALNKAFGIYQTPRPAKHRLYQIHLPRRLRRAKKESAKRKNSQLQLGMRQLEQAIDPSQAQGGKAG